MILLKILLAIVALILGIIGFVLSKNFSKNYDYDTFIVGITFILVSIGLVGCAVFCNF